jgi:hypothetical protein
MFNLALARNQPLLGSDPFLVFRDQQYLQRFPVQSSQVGKRAGQHARSMP